MSNTLYRHSGKLGAAPFMLPLVTFPVIILLSCIYAYITVYNPISGTLTFLITALYAVGIGCAISFIGRAFKCRSAAFLTAFGVVGGIVGLYFSWVFFLNVLLHTSGNSEGSVAADMRNVGILDIIFHPKAMWETIKDINESGWFSIKGTVPSGAALWFLWFLEAVIIVSGTVLIANGAIENEMFCEKCGKWCRTEEDKFLKINDALLAANTSDIKPEGLSALETLPQETLPCIKAVKLKCPNCIDNTGWKYFKLFNEDDGKGNIKMKTETINGVVVPAFK